MENVTQTVTALINSSVRDFTLDAASAQPNDSSGRNLTLDPASTQPNGAASRGPITWDDATWILTSAFIIFTMQSGFGLLEAGSVSAKNEVNIMVKNAVDVVFGGLSYWMFGYALSFGAGEWSNPFCGFGDFFVDTNDPAEMGITYSNFVFQLSFATTSTTIVSGAMAERTKLLSYIIYSFFNTLCYCLPAHWMWDTRGFLYVLGVIDVAGSGTVHLLGGTAALVAAVMLKPRLGRYEKDQPAPVTNHTNCMIGMFMLWWGWLAFNCGSTFGISGGKWKLAAKSAATTLTASMAGGTTGIVYSFLINKKKFRIQDLVNGILGALVGITGSCAVCRPWEALLIGMVGAFVALIATAILDKLHIDDPVGAVGVHGFAGMWGMLAVGIFVEVDPFEDLTRGRSGLLWGGSVYLLGVQALACVCIMAWSGIVTFITLFILQMTIGLRMSEEDERLGADFVEHNIPTNMAVATCDCGAPWQRRGSFGFRKNIAKQDSRNDHDSIRREIVSATITSGDREQDDSAATVVHADAIETTISTIITVGSGGRETSSRTRPRNNKSTEDESKSNTCTDKLSAEHADIVRQTNCESDGIESNREI